MSKAVRLACALALAVPVIQAGAAKADTSPLPPVKHVWTIMLENTDFTTTAAEDVLLGSAYLTHTLASQGALVPNYFGTGHSSGDNYVSMLSGQGPTRNTQNDCGDDSVVGGKHDGTDEAAGRYATSAQGFDADGQALGDPAAINNNDAGCVYAADVPTVVDQLKAAGLSWRGYMEDIDADPTHKRTTCQAARWAGQLNAAAGKVTKAHDDYRRKHDPFEYFHSITGLLPASGVNQDTQGHTPAADCDANVVPLPRLLQDLRSEATTPAMSYITPNQCNDGHDNPCSDGTTPAGVAQIDRFLPSIVDPILASPAYRDGGLLIITVDEGTVGSCCGEKRSPNLRAGQDNGGEGGYSADPVPATRGGGQVGSVMLSPYITPNTVSSTCYNHYSWLRSIEDLLRLTPTAMHVGSGPDPLHLRGSDGQGHLGYAGTLGDGVVPATIGGQVVPCTTSPAFGADVFGVAQPAPVVPEVPLAVTLPLAVLAVAGGFGLLRKRRAA